MGTPFSLCTETSIIKLYIRICKRTNVYIYISFNLSNDLKLGYILLLIFKINLNSCLFTDFIKLINPHYSLEKVNAMFDNDI